MGMNTPDDLRDNDPNAPWNLKDETPCSICGGELAYRDNGPECIYCGCKDPEEVNVCSMCNDNRPKIEEHKKGYRAECKCGVSSQFEANAEAALTSWNILNE